ncbi:cell division protein SepF [Aeribacillus sp. FSL K6-2848]|uniref:cell division protein SepF n=1 Tax=Aeribacillus sp. FSL K6-2848 TaxID=2954612 RepID=UPI0030F5B1ED
MSLKNKFKSFFAIDDEDYEIEDMEAPEEKHQHEPIMFNHNSSVEKNAAFGKQNVVSLQSAQKSTKVILCEPRTYSEAQEIADHLKNRRSCIVNLQRIGHDQAKRIVDFLSGTVYAIGGDIQRVGTNIFLCTPDNVDVAGSISDFMADDENKRW